MKKQYIKILIVLMAFSIASCKKTFDNLQNNPNSPTPASADVDLYINQIELSFNGFYQGAETFGAQLSRQQNWGGPLYQNAYTPPSFDGLWSTAYSSIINNVNAMVPLAESENKFIQAGIGRTLKAYTLATMVDDFGDIPDSESELGTANPNPKLDAGSKVYAHVQALLDTAITDFGKTGAAAVGSDLFYNGNAANWATFAKTMKLKFYMQTRLVDNTVTAKIKALLTENDLINTPAQDFEFRYGTNNNSPDSRHPHYAADYTASGGEGEYQSNYFMWAVAAQKYGGSIPSQANTGDPRVRYYFYRQVDNIAWANQGTLPCFPQSQYGSSTFPAWYPPVPSQTPYCLVGNKGYFGRDHGDNSAVSPDANYRTAFGIYPAGGQFDANQAAIVTLSMGGLGAGISPIWQSAFTKFLVAEAATTLGLSDLGSARSLLLDGMNASITKVTTFPATVNVTVPDTYAATSAQISSYTDLVLSNYDMATSTQAKLNIIMTEYYIAAFGNGVEAYNNLRRTGMPLNLQPAVTTANPGIFISLFFYPSVYENRNVNAVPQRALGTADYKPFWDNNDNSGRAFIK